MERLFSLIPGTATTTGRKKPMQGWITFMIRKNLLPVLLRVLSMLCLISSQLKVSIRMRRDESVFPPAMDLECVRLTEVLCTTYKKRNY